MTLLPVIIATVSGTHVVACAFVTNTKSTWVNNTKRVPRKNKKNIIELYLSHCELCAFERVLSKK